MKILNQEQILKDIQPFKEEWLVEEDWWFGSSQEFDNAEYGYDVNVIHIQGKIEAIVYPLEPSKEEKGKLETCFSSILRFKIN